MHYLIRSLNLIHLEFLETALHFVVNALSIWQIQSDFINSGSLNTKSEKFENTGLYISKVGLTIHMNHHEN